MSVRVGINGFGRMGRLGFRAGWNSPDLEIVHVNEISGDAKTAAHLLEYDSVHGRWGYEIEATDNEMLIDGKRVSVSAERTPGNVPWKKHEVDFVIECTGKFKTTETLNPYFESGIKQVIVAAPVHDPSVLNIVMGCNEHLYTPDQHPIVTAASCTTNCLAPVVKVLHEKIGIKHGLITTIHDVTNTQVIVDAPHKDLRRARSALNSLIPTSTGSAKAIGMIFPELQGKLNGLAIRVPLLNASLTDCVFEMQSEVTVEQVNQLFQDAADTYLQGILGIEHKPLVSADFLNDQRSSIVDALSTMVVNDTQLKVLSWYDNEIGYAHRMMDLASYIVRQLGL